MVVSKSVIVVKINEDLIFLCETAGDKWVCECLVGDGKVVEAKHLVDLELG